MLWLIHGPGCGRLIKYPVPATGNCCKLFHCPPWKETFTAGQPPVLHFMNPLGHGWQVSLQLIWLLLTPTFKSWLLLSNLHLPLAHFSPLCLTTLASPEPPDSPDPSSLAFSGCTLCSLCLILFHMFCSQRGVWEGIQDWLCWEQCPVTGGQEKQNHLMDQCLTTDRAPLRLSLPSFTSCLSQSGPFCSISNEHSLFPGF